MAKPRWLAISTALGATAATVAGWLLYDRRARDRIPGSEGIDAPEVAEGFIRAALMPQMRLLRWFVARRAADLVPTGEALDLGCGPGLLAIQLARRAPGLCVIGVDLSDEMLAQAEGHALSARLAERVVFTKGDVRQLPFVGRSVDLAISTAVPASLGTAGGGAG